MKAPMRAGLVSACLALAMSPVMANEDGGGGEDNNFDYLCSPGYFKNHPEVWQDLAGDDFDALMTLLNANGKTHDNPGAHKQEAASYINSLVIDAYGELPCEDGDPVE